MAVSPSSVASLYRHTLCAAAKSVPAHRAWMLRYVRDKFREESSPLSREQRFREGQDELRRFIETLRKTGRIDAPLPLEDPPMTTALPSGGHSDGIARDTARPLAFPDKVSDWTVDEVQRWLRREKLAEELVLSAFARHSVDGALLLELDVHDLEGELGMTSRLQRKRIIARIRSLAKPAAAE